MEVRAIERTPFDLSDAPKILRIHQVVIKIDPFEEVRIVVYILDQSGPIKKKHAYINILEQS